MFYSPYNALFSRVFDLVPCTYGPINSGSKRQCRDKQLWSFAVR